MGCDSRQFASMERYLVRACRVAVARGHSFHVAYDAPPTSEEFVGALESAGGELLVLGSNRSVPRLMRDLDRTIRRRRIDILHAYFTPACHYAMAYAWARRMPGRVRTSANMPLTIRQATRPLGPIGFARFAVTQRILAALPRTTLVLSEAMLHEFALLGVKESSLRVVSGGVDEEYFLPPTNSERAAARASFRLGDEIAVVTAARLVPVKCLDTLLEASKKLPGVQFILAGDGPLRANLEALARTLGITDRVMFAGQLSDARDLLAAADIFALPSRSEGLSNSIMEAMACGLPVVASSIRANAEVVTDGETGLLVPVADVQALTKAIERLATDVDLRSQYGATGRRRIQDHFNVGRRVVEEIAVYERLLG